MPTIMEILRHTQISQTRRYVKGRSHLSKDAMRRMGEFFVPPPQAPAEASNETGTETTDTARPVPAVAAASAERKNPSSDHIWAGVPVEPPVGFEPTTYALQVRCSGQLS